MLIIFHRSQRLDYCLWKILLMSFFRQYVAPFIVLLIFLFALFAVSIRIFLPSDMAAPAPVSLENLSTTHVTYRDTILTAKLIMG